LKAHFRQLVLQVTKRRHGSALKGRTIAAFVLRHRICLTALAGKIVLNIIQHNDPEQRIIEG
jgi:hypothetical protein